MIHKTDWLDIIQVIDKDDKYIFITEKYDATYGRKNVIVRAPKTLFGFFRNRKPKPRDRVSFHLNDDGKLVGFEIYEYDGL